MNILLINPIRHEKESAFTEINYPPIGLLQVARKYIEEGHDVQIWDGQVMSDKYLYEIIKDVKLDIVGFNVMIGQPLKTAYEMSEAIKETRPETRIIWGGPITRIMPYVIPKYVMIDNNYYDKFPAWDILPKLYVQFYEQAIYTSRGCNFNCQFCFHQKDDKFKMDSVEEVMGHMGYLKRNFGWNDFKIMDDNFFTYLPRTKKLLEQMKSSGHTVKQAHSNGSCFKPELIEILDKSIVKKIGISIEHGDQEIINKLKKGISLEKVYKVIKQLGDKGIPTIHNFIFGLPYSTPKRDKQNFEVMKKIKDLSPHARGVGFTFVPLPETPITKEIEKSYGEYPKTLKFWQDFDMSDIKIKYNKWSTKKEIKEYKELSDRFNKEYNKKGSRRK